MPALPEDKDDHGGTDIILDRSAEGGKRRGVGVVSDVKSSTWPFLAEQRNVAACYEANRLSDAASPYSGMIAVIASDARGASIRG